MTILYVLMLLSLGMGAVGLGAFLWSLTSGQYDDLAGAAERVLMDADDAPPEAGSPPEARGARAITRETAR